LRDLLRTVELRPIVADLSLGAWTAHSIAKQFSAQLGITPAMPTSNDYRTLGRRGLSYADLISHGIDVESVGNRVVDVALHFMRLFREVSSSITPFVILPKSGVHWEDEDVLFLSFWARDVGHACLRLVCCDAVPPTLPGGWAVEWDNEPQPAASGTASLLSLVPGIIGPHFAILQDGLSCVTGVPFHDGWLIVAPESRRAPRDVAKLEWDRLALRTKDLDSAVAAFAQYYGNNLYVNGAALCNEAWAQFADGGVGLALRYMERVQECAASLEERASAQAQKQGMRIAQLHFADAAREPEPASRILPELRSFLLQAKGWGCVQTGAAREALTLFSAAEEAILKTSAEKREILYLLNIKALAELRCGNADEALRIEQQIERELATLEKSDWQLTYINAINQARLYKRLHDWSRSEKYYFRAFSTTWGLRSESDMVYTNICLAILAESAGRPEDALPMWVRAGLHWVASARPEALTSRIARALLPGLPLQDMPYGNCASFVEEVSAALLRKLSEIARHCNDMSGWVHRRGARFARIEDVVGECNIDAAIGGEGWSVLAGTTKIPSADRGGAHAQLRSWLGAWIGDSCATTEDTTYLIDGRCGREMALTFDELVETCARRRVTYAMYRGDSTVIEVGALRALERNMTVRVGAGVESISVYGARAVRFKRYRPPRPLTPEEACLVDTAKRGGAIEPAGVSLAAVLEEARVVERVLERRACVAAGIKLPSNAS
jgi:tetratricopeptide (TPR) repeat protein